MTSVHLVSTSLAPTGVTNYCLSLGFKLDLPTSIVNFCQDLDGSVTCLLDSRSTHNFMRFTLAYSIILKVSVLLSTIQIGLDSGPVLNSLTCVDVLLGLIGDIGKVIG